MFLVEKVDLSIGDKCGAEFGNIKIFGLFRLGSAQEVVAAHIQGQGQQPIPWVADAVEEIFVKSPFIHDPLMYDKLVLFVGCVNAVLSTALHLGWAAITAKNRGTAQGQDERDDRATEGCDIYFIHRGEKVMDE